MEQDSSRSAQQQQGQHAPQGYDISIGGHYGMFSPAHALDIWQHPSLSPVLVLSAANFQIVYSSRRYFSLTQYVILGASAQVGDTTPLVEEGGCCIH